MANRPGTPLTWRGPAPSFHESLWGIVQKVSHLNALDLADRRKVLGIIGFGAPQVTHLSPLIPSIPRGEGALWSLASELSTRKGARFPAHLRFCARCMEYGFHSVIFQVPELQRCPAHGDTLQERCPACRHEILYDVTGRHADTRPFECACGALLWSGRDEVRSWYRSVPERQAIDAFARRLCDSQRRSTTVWLRLDPPGTAIAHGSSLSERLATLCPSELLKLPRSDRVLFGELACHAFTGRIRLKSEASKPVSMSRLAPQIEQVDRLLTSELKDHWACIRSVGRGNRYVPAGIAADQCAIGNALLLWRAHWNTIVVRRKLCDFLTWLSDVARSQIQEWAACRNSTPLEERSCHVAVPAPSARSDHCLELWPILCVEALSVHLQHTVVLVDQILQRTGRPRAPSTSASTDRHEACVPRRLPPMWLVANATDPSLVELYSPGIQNIRSLNRRACVSIAPAGSAVSEGSTATSQPFPKGSPLEEPSFWQLGSGYGIGDPWS